jgi:sialate O-acetylesterase
MIRRKNGAIGLALAAVSLLGLAALLPAQVRLPAVIGDHMVVQQDKPVTIWGGAGKAEPVTVVFSGREKKTVAAADGTWRVVFDPVKAGDSPLTMTVRGAKGPEIVVQDILVG